MFDSLEIILLILYFWTEKSHLNPITMHKLNFLVYFVVFLNFYE